MKARKIAGREVAPIGLGCMGLSHAYGTATDKTEAVDKLDLEIQLMAPFRDHLDIFENGEQTDSYLSADFDYDRLGAIVYGEYCAG